MKEKVDYLKIGGNVEDTWGEFGWVYTKSGNLYYLWWTGAWPEETTAVDHVKRSLWTTLVRDAMVNNLDVEFLTDDYYSAKVLTVKLFAP